MAQRLFRSVEEFEETADPTPSAAETGLIAAVRNGKPYRHADARPTEKTEDNTVRASLLRLLILGGTPECGLQPFGVWLEGAWIEGQLDLQLCTAQGRTGLQKCHFHEMPVVAQAHFKELSFGGCRILGGVLAQEIHVDASLVLLQTEVVGTISLSGAIIGGQLSFADAVLSGPQDASGAVIGMALYAQGADIRDGIYLRGAKAVGTIDLNRATIRGQFACERANLSGPRDGEGTVTERALNAQQAKIWGSVFLREMEAVGTIDLSGATIGGQLSCTGAALSGPRNADGAVTGYSLAAQGAKIGDSAYLHQTKSVGTITLSGATIGRQVECHGASWSGPCDANGAVTGNALAAQQTKIGESIDIGQLEALGTIHLAGARIGGQLLCDGAILSGPKDADGAVTERALNLQGAKIGDGVFLSRLAAVGTIDLKRTSIGGQLVCEWARLSGPLDAAGVVSERAIDAQSVTIGEGLIFVAVSSVTGGVDLVAGHCFSLVDDEESWKRCSGDIYLDGFTYDRIGPASPMTLAERQAWLKRGAHWRGTFYPQPYTQFAKVLRETGHSAEARRVRIAAEEHRVEIEFPTIKGPQRPLYWIWDRVKRWTVGYGYAPWRSLCVLVGLIGIAWILAHLAWEEGSFAPNSGPILLSDGWASVQAAENPAAAWSEDTALGGDWDTFSALAYAFDVVVPLIEIGQTQAWAPSTERGPMGVVLWWMRWVLTILGWIVTALGAAAVTGIVQRGQPD